MEPRRSSGAIAAKGLVPLLDCLFLLLISLLAVSEARSDSRAEQVRVLLPKIEAGESGPGTGARVLVLEIDAQSQLRLGDGGPVLASRAELDRALGELLGEDLPEEVVIEIRGDRGARHGVAVELLQHLRLRGFPRVELLAMGGATGGDPFGGGR